VREPFEAGEKRQLGVDLVSASQVRAPRGCRVDELVKRPRKHPTDRPYAHAERHRLAGYAGQHLHRDAAAVVRHGGHKRRLEAVPSVRRRKENAVHCVDAHSEVLDRLREIEERLFAVHEKSSHLEVRQDPVTRGLHSREIGGVTRRTREQEVVHVWKHFYP
jgi:hypothetical protein